MKYLHLEENDFENLMDCVNSVSHSYRSGNRRAYIANILLSYSRNRIEFESAKKDLKYFRKLLSEKDLNDNREKLTVIVGMLEKYIESSTNG